MSFWCLQISQKTNNFVRISTLASKFRCFFWEISRHQKDISKINWLLVSNLFHHCKLCTCLLVKCLQKNGALFFLLKCTWWRKRWLRRYVSCFSDRNSIFWKIPMPTAKFRSEAFKKVWLLMLEFFRQHRNSSITPRVIQKKFWWEK